MSDTTDRVSWREVLRPEWIPSLAVLLGGVLVHAMNVMLVATVLPSIVGEVGGAHLLAWPMTSFLAASIIAATSSGLVAAGIGPRGGYMLGAALFAVGSIICALAPSMNEIVVGRFIQGFGGGTIAGLAYVLVRKTFPNRVWPRVFALLSGIWSVAVLLGPLIGGIFAGLGNWRAAFITVAIVAALLGALTWFALPRVAADPARNRRFPARRLLLVIAGIAILSLASILVPTWQRAVSVAVALAVLGLMLRIDRKADNPILPSDAFSVRTITGAGLLVALMMSLIFTQITSFMPVFLQQLHNVSALTSGYMVACASLVWTMTAVSISGLTAPWPLRLIRTGPVFMTLGLAGLAVLTDQSSHWHVLPAIALMGCAMGSTWAFLVQQVMQGARKGEEDIAASSVATIQQGGLAIGAALAGIVANIAGLANGLNPETAAAAAFWVPFSFLPFGIVAIIVAVVLARHVKSQAPMHNPAFR